MRHEVSISKRICFSTPSMSLTTSLFEKRITCQPWSLSYRVRCLSYSALTMCALDSCPPHPSPCPLPQAGEGSSTISRPLPSNPFPGLRVEEVELGRGDREGDGLADADRDRAGKAHQDGRRAEPAVDDGVGA